MPPLSDFAKRDNPKMSLLENLATGDSLVEQNTRQNHSEIVALLDRWLEHFSRASEILTGYITKGEDFYMLMVWTNAFNTAISIYDRLLKGYYAQAGTLMRSFHEQYIRFRYCVLHPEKIERLRAGKGPKVTDMQSEILRESPEPVSVSLKEGYKTLSEFAHGDILALIDTTVSREQSTTLRVGGWYKQDWFLLLANGALGFLGILQLEFAYRFKEPLERDQDWMGILFQLLDESIDRIQSLQIPSNATA